MSDTTRVVDDDLLAERPHGALRRALHRLTSPEHVLDAEQRQELVAEHGGTPVGRCADRSQACVVGTLRTVTIQPRGASLALQAELWDGSGSIDIIWIGRRRIAVNLRLAEPDAVAAIPVKHFDGLHWTSDPVMDGRTVKDMWF